MNINTKRENLRIPLPVSRSVVGKNLSRSGVLVGHPNTENGNKAAENHVSSTSWSCSSTMSSAGTSDKQHIRTSLVILSLLLVCVMGRGGEEEGRGIY